MKTSIWVILVIQDSDSFCANGDACQKPVETAERKDELKLILLANCGGSDQEEVDPGDLEPEVNVQPVSSFVAKLGPAMVEEALAHEHVNE